MWTIDENEKNPGGHSLGVTVSVDIPSRNFTRLRDLKRFSLLFLGRGEKREHEPGPEPVPELIVKAIPARKEIPLFPPNFLRSCLTQVGVRRECDNP